MANWYFFCAGVLLAAGFAVHMIVGNRAWSLLDPCREPQCGDDERRAVLRGIWLMGRGGCQMIGADLLVPGVYFLLAGIGVTVDCFVPALLFAVLYGLYCIGWLLGQLFSRASAVSYLRNAQWMLFLVVFVLIVCGMTR